MNTRFLDFQSSFLIKDRSYRAILKESHDLLFANMSTFLRSLWPILLAMGLVGTLCLFLLRVSSPTWVLWEMGACMLLGIYFTAILLQMVAAMLLNMTEEKRIDLSSLRQLGRSVKGKVGPTFCLLLSQGFCIALLAGISLWLNPKMPYIWIVSLILCLLLVVPFNLSLFYQVFSGKNVLMAVKWGFVCAKNNYGSTFFLLFVAFWEICIAVLLCCLPLVILSFALFQSNKAVLMGDVSDLPSYVPMLHGILSILSVAAITFFQLFWILPQSFQLGTILSRRQKRLEKR